MTDFEMFKSLLDKWGVGYKVQESRKRISIKLEKGIEKKVYGYRDNYALVMFDADGKFENFSI